MLSKSRNEYNSYPILYSTCRLVNGARNSLIYDLGRQCYYSVPRSIAKVISSLGRINVDGLVKKFGEVNREAILECLFFLEDKELIFFTDDYTLYPNLKVTILNSRRIKSSIVEVSKDRTISDFDYMFHKLSGLMISALELRVYHRESFDRLRNIIKQLEGTSITYVRLIVPDLLLDPLVLFEYMQSNYRLQNVVLTGAQEDRVIVKGTKVIKMTTKKIDSKKFCGVIDESEFSVNAQAFSEFSLENSCLGDKISIDIDGGVCNCPSMKGRFGSIYEVDLMAVVKSLEFCSVQSIKKDDINICKYCEYRYMCIDCRAYLEEPDNILSKPLKCGYDPYTGKAKKWSLIDLKKQSIAHYDLTKI